MERKGLRIVERNYHSRWGELDLVAVDLDFNEEETDHALCAETDETLVQELSGDSLRRKYELACKNNRIHFVEVKTRTDASYGTPAEAVTYAKQQKIKKTALTWLQSQEQYFSGISFDVIEICVEGGTAKIRWLQHCF